MDPKQREPEEEELKKWIEEETMMSFEKGAWPNDLKDGRRLAALAKRYIDPKIVVADNGIANIKYLENMLQTFNINFNWTATRVAAGNDTEQLIDSLLTLKERIVSSKLSPVKARDDSTSVISKTLSDIASGVSTLLGMRDYTQELHAHLATITPGAGISILDQGIIAAGCRHLEKNAVYNGSTIQKSRELGQEVAKIFSVIKSKYTQLQASDKPYFLPLLVNLRRYCNHSTSLPSNCAITIENLIVDAIRNSLDQLDMILFNHNTLQKELHTALNNLVYWGNVAQICNFGDTPFYLLLVNMFTQKTLTPKDTAATFKVWERFWIGVSKRYNSQTAARFMMAFQPTLLDKCNFNAAFLVEMIQNLAKPIYVKDLYGILLTYKKWIKAIQSRLLMLVKAWITENPEHADSWCDFLAAVAVVKHSVVPTPTKQQLMQDYFMTVISGDSLSSANLELTRKAVINHGTCSEAEASTIIQAIIEKAVSETRRTDFDKIMALADVPEMKTVSNISSLFKKASSYLTDVAVSCRLVQKLIGDAPLSALHFQAITFLVTKCLDTSKNVDMFFLFRDCKCLEEQFQFEENSKEFLQLKESMKMAFEDKWKVPLELLKRGFQVVCEQEDEMIDIPKAYTLLVSAFCQLCLQDKASSVPLVCGVLEEVARWEISAFSIIFFTQAADILKQPIREQRFRPYRGLKVFHVFSEKCLPRLDRFGAFFNQLVASSEESINSTLKEVVNDLYEKEFTESELNLIYKNEGALKDLCNIFLNEEVDFKDNVKRRRAEFKSLITQYDTLNVIREWIINEVRFHTEKIVKDEIDSKELRNKNVKLCKLVEAIDSISEIVQLQGEEQMAVHYFYSRDNQLFKAVVKGILKNMKVQKSSHIVSLANQAITFLKQLLDDENVKIADLEAYNLGNIISSLRGTKKPFKEELDTVATYFNEQFGKKKIDLKRLEEAIQLLEYSRGLPVMLQCLEQYSMSCMQSLKELRVLVREITPQREQFAQNNGYMDITLAQVPVRIKEINRYTNQLASYHLKYFEVVASSARLVNFLASEQDFRSKIEMLNAQLRKSPEENALISSLRISKESLEPFISFRNEQDFGVIAQYLLRCFPTEESMIDKLGKLENVNASLSKIQMWFKKTRGLSMENVHGSVMKIKESGKFKSRLRQETEKPSLYVEYMLENETKPEVIPEDELVDLVRSAIFCSTDVVAGEEVLNELEEFVACYNLAAEVHSLRLSLEELGNPDYQRLDNALAESIDVNLLKEKKAYLAGLRKHWIESMNTEVSALKNLLFLSKRQLIKFMNLIKSYKQHQEKIPDCYSQLEGYLITCFHEVLKTNPGLLEEKLVVECMQSAIADGYKNNMSDLQLSRHFLGLVRSKLQSDEDEDDIDMDIIGVSKSNVVGFFNKGNDELFCLLLHLFDVSAHDTNNDSRFIINSGQLFWCDESTTIAELEWFQKRRLSFPNLIYVMVNVHLLSSSVREELVKMEEVDSPKGETYLIFGGSSGFDIFENLVGKSTPADLHEQRQYITALKNIIVNHPSRKISQFNVVHGKPTSGKSTFIRGQVNQIPNAEYLQVSVTEDFSTENFVKRYSGFKNKACVALHFNVSCFADFESFNKFLFNFFFCGLFFDETCGDIVAPNSATTWHIFVEIPNNPYLEETHYHEKFLRQVPVCKFLMKSCSEVTAEFPFVIDNNVRKLCAFYKRRQTATLATGRLYELESLNNDAECTQLLNQIFKQCPAVTNNKFYQQMFVKLMVDRINFLSARDQHIINMLEDVGDLQQFENRSNELFDLFLDECAYLCNQKIKQSWAKCEVGFTARYFSEDFTIAQLEILQLTARNEDVAKNKSRGLQALDKGTAITYPARLRSALAYGMGIKEGNRFLEVLSENNYIMTHDFAIKLLVLNERRKVRSNVILCGDTGIGKTEILHLLAELLNQQSSVKPDTTFMLRNFIKQEELAVNLKLYDTQESKHQKKKVIEQIFKSLWESKNDEQLLEFGKKLITYVNTQIFALFPLLEKSQLVKKLTDEVDTLTSLSGSEMQRFVLEVLNCKPKGLFHRILMHQGINASAFKQKIMSIVDQTRENSAKHSNFNTVVFIDELNTSITPGLVKEVFVDHSLEGIKLPDNIFFVGAINPSQAMNEKGNNAAPEFLVSDVSSSMYSLMLDFKALSEDQESSFLEQLIFSDYHSLAVALSHEEKQGQKQYDLLHTILWAQQYVREKKLERVHVSIRDLCRAVQLYKFFSTNPTILKHRGDEGQVHWARLFVTIGMAYYFRLPTYLRKQFAHDIHVAIRKNGSFLPEKMKFEQTVLEELDSFYSKLSIPAGIAKTRTFTENLFCNIICIESKIPLIITGPPGTSKTLSFSVASNNQLNKKIHRYFYQCSEQSTANEIKQAYKSAVSMQMDFEKANMLSEICTVFLDEAGLPTEKKHALKVIHYYLDHPKVSSVIISNTMLDAAKTNRAIQLLQSDTTSEDLEALAFGCLMLDGQVPEYERRIIKGLCDAFQTVNKIIEPDEYTRANLFHLRDFVYFLRYLPRKKKNRYVSMLDPSLIYESLQRNFNGVSPSNFERISNHFISCIHHALADATFMKSFGVPQRPKSYMTIVSESVNDRVSAQEDPNHAPFRYVLVLDPSESESSIGLLLPMIKNPTVCYVSDFEEDNNEFSLSQVISKVKLAMATGQTVILVNSERINSNFYDVFNRHFTPIKGDNQKVEYFAKIAVGAYSRACPVHPDFQIIVHMPISKLKTAPLPFLNRFEKYILSFSHVLEQSLESLTPSEKLDVRGTREKKDIFQIMAEGCQNFVEQLRAQTFYGLVPKETVNSMALAVLDSSETSIPNIEEPFKIDDSVVEAAPVEEVMEAEEDVDDDDVADEDEDFEPRPKRQKSSPQREEPAEAPKQQAPKPESTASPYSCLREYIRRANFNLLQLVKPDSIYLQRKFLPKAYLIEYLSQEHFSLLRFTSQLLRWHFVEQTTNTSNKWVVFTRSSAKLHLLATDIKLQQKLLSGLRTSFDVQNPQKSVHIVNLSACSSQQACDKYVDDFFSSPHQQIFVCLADMSSRSISKNQLNYLRFRVDEKLKSRTVQKTGPLSKKGQVEPLILVIVFFPPERSQFANTYDAIYSNNWRFNYVDSFDADENTSKASDPRWWIRVSLGLQEGLPKQSLIDEFKDIYKSLVDTASQHFKSITGEVGRQVKSFLSEMLNHRIIQEQILNVFASLWKTTYLSKLVYDACVAVQSGESSAGILQLIKSSLEYLLVGTIIYFAQKLGEYGTFISAKAATAEDAKHKDELLRFMLKTLEIPDHKVLLSKIENQLYVIGQQIRDAKIPLFNPLLERIDNCLSQMPKVGSGTSHQHQIATMTEQLERSDLKPVLQFFSKNPLNYDLFLSEFCKARIGITKKGMDADQFAALEKLIRHVITSTEMGVSIDFETMQNIAGLFFIDQHYRKDLHFIKHLFMTLPHGIKQEQVFGVFKTDVSIAAVINRLYVRTAITLFDQLKQGFEDGFAFSDWSQSFSTLLSALEPFNRARIERCNPQVKNSILYCFVVYSYCVSFAAVDAYDDLLEDVNRSGLLDYKSIESIQQECDEVVGKLWSSRLKRKPLDPSIASQARLWASKLLTTIFQIDNAKNLSSRRAVLAKFLAIVNNTSATQDLWVTYLDPKVRAQMVHDYWMELNQHSGLFQELVEAELAKNISNGDMEFVPEVLQVDSKQPPYKTSMLENVLFSVLLKRNETESSSKAQLDHLALELQNLSLDMTSSSSAVYLKLLKRIKYMAFLVFFIRCIAKELNKDGEIEKIVELWKPETVQIINTFIMSNQQYKAFLLKSIPRQTRIEDLLTANEHLIKTLSLEDWKMQKGNSANQLHPHQMPFCYDESARSAEFNTLRNIFFSSKYEKLQAYVNQKIQQRSKPQLYQLRMFLFSIAHYYYFSFCKRCDMLLQLLQDQNIINELDINEAEKKAFMFVANGPLTANQAGTSDLLQQFSEEYLKNPSNSKWLFHLVLNIMALTVGLPRYTSHMYTRAFDPKKLPGTLGPCSMYQDHNWDCGYQTDGYKIGTVPHILNGSTFYWGAMHVFTWGSLLIPLLLDKASFDPQYAKSSHMLNYAEDDYRLVKNKTAFDKVDLYVLNRVNTFATLFSLDQNVTSKNIDTLFFFTICCNLYWEAVMSGVHDNVAKGVFEKAEPLRAYENFFRDIAFARALNEYETFNQIFQKASDQNKKLAIILKGQEKVFKFVRSTELFPPYGALEQYVSDQIEKGADEDTKLNARAVHYFMQKREKKLKSLTLLSVLADFYTFIHNAFKDRFTLADLYNVTISDALLQLDTESKTTIHKQKFDKFKETWKQAREMQEVIEICNDAARNNINEQDILNVEDTTLLVHMLTFKGDECADGLYRLIDNLTKSQKDCLTSLNVAAPNEYSAFNLFEHNKTERAKLSKGKQPANKNVMQDDDDEDEEEVENSNQADEYQRRNLSLITCSDLNGEFVRFVTTSCQFDEKANQYMLDLGHVRDEIVEKYLATKPSLSVNKIYLSLKPEAKQKQLEQVKQQPEDQPKEANTTYPLVIYTLEKQIRKAHPKLTRTSTLRLDRALTTALQQCTPEEMLELCKYITTINAALFETLEDDEQVLEVAITKFIEQQSLPSPPAAIESYFAKICKGGTILSFMLLISERALAHYFEIQNGKFDSIQQLNVPPSQIVKKKLATSEGQVLASLNQSEEVTVVGAPSADDYLYVMQQVASILLAKHNEQTLNDAQNHTKPLAVLFESQLKEAMKNSKVYSDALQVVLPQMVLLQNYVYYLRFLKQTIGKLECRIYATKAKGDKYIEKVPANLAERQKMLENSEVVFLHAEAQNALELPTENNQQQQPQKPADDNMEMEVEEPVSLGSGVPVPSSLPPHMLATHQQQAPSFSSQLARRLAAVNAEHQALITKATLLERRQSFYEREFQFYNSFVDTAASILSKLNRL